MRLDQASAPHQPLSGDVSQWLRVFSPTVTVNGRGDPDLEGEIVRDVATYGAQLGPLTALVLALAEGTQVPADALTKLREICLEIKTKKDAVSARRPRSRPRSHWPSWPRPTRPDWRICWPSSARRARRDEQPRG